MRPSFACLTVVLCERISIPNLVLFPNQGLSMRSRTVFPTRVLRVGVRISFVQEEQQDLQFVPIILTICVLVDVSIHPGILVSVF